DRHLPEGSAALRRAAHRGAQGRDELRAGRRVPEYGAAEVSRSGAPDGHQGGEGEGRRDGGRARTENREAALDLRGRRLLRISPEQRLRAERLEQRRRGA